MGNTESKDTQTQRKPSFLSNGRTSFFKSAFTTRPDVTKVKQDLNYNKLPSIHKHIGIGTTFQFRPQPPKAIVAPEITRPVINYVAPDAPTLAEQLVSAYRPRYLGSNIGHTSADDIVHEIRMNRIKQQHQPPAKRLLYPSIHSLRTIDSKISAYKQHDEKYFPKPKEFPELTDAIKRKIYEVTQSPSLPQHYKLTEIDGAEILKKDLQTLLGLNWLNDEVMNSYLYLLVQRGQDGKHKKVYKYNTFFYPKLRDSGYNSIKRWTKKVDIFSYDFLIVPVHLGNHWCLAFVDFTKKIISYYDSMNGSANGCCDRLLEYLKQESNDKKKQDFDHENWRLIDTRYDSNVPRQDNCSDCGVFSCTYAEYLTRQAKFNFTQEHMPYFRQKMIYEIVTKQILE